MKRESLNNGWSFCLDEDGNFSNFAPSQKYGESVTLPHDFIIGKEREPDVPGKYRTGYYPGAAGIYTKYLNVGEQVKDKKVFLEIDGAYMNSIVMLNSDIVQKHPYGYSAFHADLTKYLKVGKKNKLSIYVNNCFLPNSRWYTGGGLYRDVNMLVSEKVYFRPWSLLVKTESIHREKAVIAVSAVVENESEKDFNGKCCFIIEQNGNPINHSGFMVHIKAGDSKEFGSSISIEKPHLWDVGTPNLYQMTATLQVDVREIDTDVTDFGIRTVSADPINGLLLNGHTIKLKGGCVHHDCGILGAAAYRDYEYRKVKIHKDNGYNAIRCAHNPPSTHFLNACDRYGILVIDEAFDTWRMGKTLNDYSLFFEDWWERDLLAMIMRDRNHPSVIMWSIGNEIGERSGDSDGYEWAKKISDYARSLDSTRLITSGICAIWPTEEQEKEFKETLKEEETATPVMGEKQKTCQKEVQEINLDTPFSKKYWGTYTEKFAEVLDVVGYNYLENRYKEDGRRYPDRVICGTESFAQSIDMIWKLVEECPHVIGDFAWTSYDYIGEAGIGKALYFEKDEMVPDYEIAHVSPYPWRLANDSDFDICGFPTPQAAYRRIVWGSKETFIAVHNPENYGKQELLSMWGWSDCSNDFTFHGYEGKPIEVTVYSKAMEVELFHNGKSLGKRKPERMKANYHLIYEPGELRAISYDNEEFISEDAIRTSGTPYSLRITLEPENLLVSEQQLIFAVIEIVDMEGNLVPVNGKIVQAEVTGALTLKALGSADPRAEGNYTRGSFPSYHGKLLAIIAKGCDKTQDSKVKDQLYVRANELKPAVITVIFQR